MTPDEQAYALEHARNYALWERDPDPDAYARWYVAEFSGDPFDRAPAHSSVYWVYWQQRHTP